MDKYSRLSREILALKRNPEWRDKVAVEHTDDISKTFFYLRGEAATPYEHGIFKLEVRIPGTYPTSPPYLRFVTRVFHPNVDWSTGDLCIDILREAWNPSLSIVDLLFATYSVLKDPNPDSPLNIPAAKLVREDAEAGFRSLAAHYTGHFALKEWPKLFDQDEGEKG